MGFAVINVFFLFWRLFGNTKSDGSPSKSIVEYGLKILISSIQLIATFSRIQENLTDNLLSVFSALDLANLNISVLGFECGVYFEPYWGL